MSTKVKGFFKGIKYITQIFDDKEKEMQIGLPTDVKHVAHIGLDGQSANAPTWMNDFTNDNRGAVGSSRQDVNEISAGVQKSMSLEVSEEKKSRRKSSTKMSSPSMSPKGRSLGTPKPRRQHRSSDKDNQDSSSSGKGRRIRCHSNNGHDSQDAPPATKHSQRRKSKGSTNDSTNSRSSKFQDCLPDDKCNFPDFGSVGVGHRQAGHVSKENEHIAMAISA